jgi:hypothetical protein
VRCAIPDRFPFGHNEAPLTSRNGQAMNNLLSQIDSNSSAFSQVMNDAATKNKWKCHVPYHLESYGISSGARCKYLRNLALSSSSSASGRRKNPPRIRNKNEAECGGAKSRQDSASSLSYHGGLWLLVIKAAVQDNRSSSNHCT